jgi:hypothetical protein
LQLDGESNAPAAVEAPGGPAILSPEIRGTSPHSPGARPKVSRKCADDAAAPPSSGAILPSAIKGGRGPMDRLKKPGYRFIAEFVTLPSALCLTTAILALIAG